MQFRWSVLQASKQTPLAVCVFIFIRRVLNVLPSRKKSVVTKGKYTLVVQAGRGTVGLKWLQARK